MGLISRVSSRTYRNTYILQSTASNQIFNQTPSKMFKSVIKRVILTKNRPFTTSIVLNQDGDKIAENERAREDQYFYNLQQQQLKALKKKTAKVEADLVDEVDELEGKMAALKNQLNKKKKQLGELKSGD